YHNWASNQQDRLDEIYYGDWFIRQAINNGFPLNTVISTKSFSSSILQKPDLFSQSILVSIVPDAGSAYERALIEFVQKGGKVIVYGPAEYASQKFKDFLNLQNKT